jgi:hypothetical protein
MGLSLLSKSDNHCQIAIPTMSKPGIVVEHIVLGHIPWSWRVFFLSFSLFLLLLRFAFSLGLLVRLFSVNYE